MFQGILVYGCQPGKGTPVTTQISDEFLERLQKIQMHNGGVVSLPVGFFYDHIGGSTWTNPGGYGEIRPGSVKFELKYNSNIEYELTQSEERRPKPIKSWKPRAFQPITSTLSSDSNDA